LGPPGCAEVKELHAERAEEAKPELAEVKEAQSALL
jgi:hypothetical protein